MRKKRYFLEALIISVLLNANGLLPAQNDPLNLELLKSISSHSDLKKIKGLLKEGAEVNAAIELGPPADANFSYYIAKRFIFKNTFAKDTLERIYITPLMAASRFGDYNLVKLLLKKGANADAADTQGKTSLVYALAKREGEQIALYLLKKGANYFALDYAGNSTLNYAVFGSNSEGIHMMLGGGVKINQGNTEGTTPFHAAAFNSNPDILDMLASLGADINALDVSRMNALHYAAAGNKIENVHFLINKNLEVNLVNAQGLTPLDVAMYEKSEDVVLALKKAGGRLNDYHYKELVAAVQEKNAQKVAEYLKEGVNPNRDHNYPILHIAVHAGNPEILEMLVRAGADVNAVTMRDQELGNIWKTPLEVAIQAKNYGLAISLLTENNRVKEEMLLELLMQGESPFSGMTNAAYYDLASRLADKPFNLEAKRNLGSVTVLQFACLWGDSILVRMLLDKGADVNVKDSEGWTAAHYAVVPAFIEKSGPPNSIEIKARIAVLKMLKEKGLDLSTPSSETGKSCGAAFSPYIPVVYCFPSRCTPLDVVNLMYGDNGKELSDFLKSSGIKSGGAESYRFVGVRYLETAKGSTGAIREEMFTRAEKALLIALELDKNYLQAYLELGSVYFYKNDYEKALKNFDLGIKALQNDAERLFEIGTAKYFVKDYPAAIANLTTAHLYAPERTDILLRRGAAYLNSKNKAKACEDFQSGKNLGDKECEASVELYCK